MYYRLFTDVYLLLKKHEYGFSNQTDDARAQVTIGTISFLEMFNLMTLFPQTIRGGVITFPLILIFVLNFMIFYIGKKYKGIVDRYSPYQGFGNSSIVYLAVTIIGFIVSRFYVD